MPPNPRLELTWIGKENRPQLEPRILLKGPSKSYHAKHRNGKKDIFDNRLIFGDNLLALKALEQEFTGKVKCIYIDPPRTPASPRLSPAAASRLTLTSGPPCRSVETFAASSPRRRFAATTAPWSRALRISTLHGAIGLI